MQSRLAPASFLTSWVGMCAFVLVLAADVDAQKKNRTPTASTTTEVKTLPTPASQEAKQSSANRIFVPVTAIDPTGRLVTDLQGSDFEVLEDGRKQNVKVLPVSDPYSVVLLMDTSISTQSKLGDIRRAATAFVDQLAPTDRLKVITFDDQVKEANDFSADRAVVKKAIQNVQSGYGTKFYDGMNVALEALRELEGRKAIVIFSDGVDYKSDYATGESTLQALEQDAVVVYPIRFNTRAAAERLARENAGPSEGPREIVKSVTPSGQRDPSDIPSQRPTTGPGTGPLGFPSPEEILQRRRDEQRTRDRVPTGDRPPAGEVGMDPTGGKSPQVSSKSRAKKQPIEDPITVSLNRLYSTADNYLQSAADKSGGQLLRADDVTALPTAFSQIAAELRAQYFLTYEPTKPRDNSYHAIKVATSRPGLTIRARQGYR